MKLGFVSAILPELELDQVLEFAAGEGFDCGFGDIDWACYMAALYDIGYDGPVCIEVEDATFGNTLEGRKRAIKAAGNVLRPYFG
jgi:sugar phosphate isomerase/epimerase